MDAVIKGPGMEYARKKMLELRDEAVKMLDGFEESDSKTALINLLDFTIERNK